MCPSVPTHHLYTLIKVLTVCRMPQISCPDCDKEQFVAKILSFDGIRDLNHRISSSSKITSCFLLSPLCCPWFHCLWLIYHYSWYYFMNACNVVCSSVHQEMVLGGPFLLYSIGIVADHAEWMSKFRRTIPVLWSLKMPFWQLGRQLCSLKGKPQSHTSFLVNIKLLPNRVGKRAITSRPASSSFIAVSCSLLRIIFCFSLLT